MTCLGKVLESTKVDRYKDLYTIVSPYLNMDKHDDEEVSMQLLIQLREKSFEAVGKAWPEGEHKSTQGTSSISFI